MPTRHQSSSGGVKASAPSAAGLGTATMASSTTTTRRRRYTFPLCKYHQDSAFSILDATSEFLDLRDLWRMRAVSRWCLRDLDHSRILHHYLLNVKNPGVSRLHFWLHLVEAGSDAGGSSSTALSGVGVRAEGGGGGGGGGGSGGGAGSCGGRPGAGSRDEEPLDSDDPLGDNPQIEAEIWRDVHRTFPQHPLFRQVGGAGQTLLTGILKQCAAMNADVGYCQGMNYVAAVLLTEALELNDDSGVVVDSPRQQRQQQSPAATPPPSAAAAAAARARGGGGAAGAAAAAAAGGSPWTVARVQRAYQCFDSTLERRIVRIMNALIRNPRYSMYGLWTNGVPDLRLRLYQLDKIVEVHLPKLHAHLTFIGLKPAQYCSQWFVTLLASTLPPRRLIRLWDNYFLRGWPFFFQVAVALMALNEGDILRMDLEDASKYFRNQQPRRRFFNVAIPTVLGAARRLHITAAQLERLALEFKQEEVDMQLRLPETSSSRTLRATPEEIAEYQGMEAVALADAAALRQKIETAARKYVDAASHHRATTAAVARGNRAMKRVDRAVASAVDATARQRLVEERNGAAEALRESLQQHASAELQLDEAQQQRDSFSGQLVHVLDGWEVRRLKAAARLYDSGVNQPQ